MLRNVTLLAVLCLLVNLQLFAFPFEVDSSESSIEFVDLQAIVSNKIIHFSWDVKEEQSGNYFIIEKSVDELKWKSVTKVASINNKLLHTYQVSQINLIEGAYEYFRLVRVDQSGIATILDKVSISHPVLANLLLIPVSKSNNKEFIVSYTSMICCDGKVIVTDKNGVIMHKEKVHLNEGYNRIELNTKNFEKGEYVVTVRNEYDTEITKSLKLENLKARRAKF